MTIEFRSSDHATLGVEVEVQLVDAETRSLRSGATEVLDALCDGEHPRVKHELFESTLEIITGICETVDEARRDLEASLAEVSPVVEAHGLRMLCSGTHPFSDWAEQDISPSPRYHRLVDEFQWPARRLTVFGIHTHVGIRSPEKAISIANALSAYIPHFLALSASSPCWLGRDTGLASIRSKVFEALPTAGLPQQFADWSEFETFMGTLIAAGTISTIREVWWDIRPHPDFGTIELRICDGMPTMTEITTVAALAQCLVDWHDNLIDRGYTPPCPKAWIVRENKWRAARHGIDAEIIVDEAGTTEPLRQAILTLVEELVPVARRLDCEKELEAVQRILEVGPSYVRQRRLRAAGATHQDVVDHLIEEFRTDTPAG
jgi:glutamate---cysteine ligase / carboxylate-amine ligase